MKAAPTCFQLFDTINYFQLLPTFSMGSIVSAIGYGLNSVISAIAYVLEAIISAIVGVIVAIFDCIFDILCCRCCGSRRRTSRASTRTGGRGYRRRGRTARTAY